MAPPTLADQRYLSRNAIRDGRRIHGFERSYERTFFDENCDAGDGGMAALLSPSITDPS